MAVMLITHDMGVIAGRTDRVVVMYAGKIAEEADTAELFFDRMRHPYSEALLASVPKTRPGARRAPPEHSRAAARTSRRPSRIAGSPRAASYATDRCRAEEPPARMSVGTGAAVHRFACFHPVDSRGRPRCHGDANASEDRTVWPVAAQRGRPRAARASCRGPIWSRSSRSWPAACFAGTGWARCTPCRTCRSPSAGRDVRARGRVRLRQDDDRTDDGRPRAADAGLGPASRARI